MANIQPISRQDSAEHHILRVAFLDFRHAFRRIFSRAAGCPNQLAQICAQAIRVSAAISWVCNPKSRCTSTAAAPAGNTQYGGPLPELSAAAAARMENPAISEADAAKARSISDVKLIGKCLYTNYNIPFVILGFALLSGTVGAVALARKIRKD